MDIESYDIIYLLNNKLNELDDTINNLSNIKIGLRSLKNMLEDKYKENDKPKDRV